MKNGIDVETVQKKNSLVSLLSSLMNSAQDWTPLQKDQPSWTSKITLNSILFLNIQ